jgi:hypothetical protein
MSIPATCLHHCIIYAIHSTHPVLPYSIIPVIRLLCVCYMPFILFRLHLGILKICCLCATCSAHLTLFDLIFLIIMQCTYLAYLLLLQVIMLIMMRATWFANPILLEFIIIVTACNIVCPSNHARVHHYSNHACHMVCPSNSASFHL